MKYIHTVNDVHATKFRRIPKDQIRMFAEFHPNGKLPEIYHPITGNENLSWLAIDLLIIGFTNQFDYEYLKQEGFVKDALAYWKKEMQYERQLVFTEVTRPDKVTDEMAIDACNKIWKSTFATKYFLPMLKNELIIGIYSRNRFEDLDPAPVEKTISFVFIEDYMRDELDD